MRWGDASGTLRTPTLLGTPGSVALAAPLPSQMSRMLL